MMQNDATPDTITRARCAELASLIAMKAAHWAADMLLFKARLNDPIHSGAIQRFTIEIGDLLAEMDAKPVDGNRS